MFLEFFAFNLESPNVSLELVQYWMSFYLGRFIQQRCYSIQLPHVQPFQFTRAIISVELPLRCYSISQPVFVGDIICETVRNEKWKESVEMNTNFRFNIKLQCDPSIAKWKRKLWHFFWWSCSEFDESFMGWLTKLSMKRTHKTKVK